MKEKKIQKSYEGKERKREIAFSRIISDADKMMNPRTKSLIKWWLQEENEVGKIKWITK